MPATRKATLDSLAADRRAALEAYESAQSTARAFTSLRGGLAVELRAAVAAGNPEAVEAVEATIRFVADAGREAAIRAGQIAAVSPSVVR